MKDVLLLVHDDAGQEARLAAGLDLVAGLDGHLSCLDIVEPPDLFNQTLASPLANAVLASDRAAERRLRADLKPWLTMRGTPFSWIDASGDFDETLMIHARLADVVVLSTQLPAGEEFPDMAAAIRAVVTHTHTPVLAVPAVATRGFDLGGSALVLWDGSAGAEAALLGAVPLLKHAGQATMLHVEDGWLAASLHDGAAYLWRHGILAHTARRDPWGAGVVQAIDRYIARHRPDYIVMGAFGSSRLHQAICGSVTRHMIDSSTVPLLLARQS